VGAHHVWRGGSLWGEGGGVCLWRDLDGDVCKRRMGEDPIKLFLVQSCELHTHCRIKTCMMHTTGRIIPLSTADHGTGADSTVPLATLI